MSGRVEAGAVGKMGGDASPYDLPGCFAVDAPASLARRVDASVAHYQLSQNPRYVAEPHHVLGCVTIDLKHWNLFNLPVMMYIKYLIVFSYLYS